MARHARSRRAKAPQGGVCRLRTKIWRQERRGRAIQCKIPLAITKVILESNMGVGDWNCIGLDSALTRAFWGAPDLTDPSDSEIDAPQLAGLRGRNDASARIFRRKSRLCTDHEVGNHAGGFSTEPDGDCGPARAIRPRLLGLCSSSARPVGKFPSNSSEEPRTAHSRRPRHSQSSNHQW